VSRSLPARFPHVVVQSHQHPAPSSASSSSFTAAAVATAPAAAARYLGGFYTYLNMQKIAGRIAQKRAETTLAPAEPEAAAAEEPAEKAPEAAAAQAKTAQAINNPMLAGESRVGRGVVRVVVVGL
jgi:hypothetical protein